MTKKILNESNVKNIPKKPTHLGILRSKDSFISLKIKDDASSRSPRLTQESPYLTPEKKFTTKARQETPNSILSTGGTKYKLCQNRGDVLIYGTGYASPLTADTSNKENQVEQEFVLEINRKKLHLIQKEIKKNNSTRKPSQNQVMGESAMDYVKEHSLNTDKNFNPQWLHLIAFRLTGNDGQVKENLVAGSRRCNSEMLYIEGRLPSLIEKHDNIKITATALVSPDTSIATDIKYKITSSNKDLLNLRFSPQSSETKAYPLRRYINTAVNLVSEGYSNQKDSTSHVTNLFADRFESEPPNVKESLSL